MQQNFFRNHYIHWGLLFFGMVFFFSSVALRKHANQPLSSFYFITGRISDFSYGSYKKHRSGKFGGVTTRYGYKFKLEEEIHTFNIEDLSKRQSEQLKEKLTTKPFVYVYYDKVVLTKTGSQVLVHDIIIGDWSLERTKTRALLFWFVLLSSAIAILIAISQLFKDYQIIKTHVKD